MSDDLVLEIGTKSQSLDKSVRMLRKLGSDYAEAERNYRVALSKEILIERDKGTPVTIVRDVCLGKDEIARLRLQRDIAETTYDAAKEAINSIKLQLKLLESQVDREWRG